MEQIIKLANDLVNTRDNINSLKSEMDILKILKDGLQEKLIEVMEQSGLKSLKTDTHNYARTIKKDIKVVDTESVYKDLKSRDLYDEYVKPKLDTVGFKTLAKAILKEDGEIMEGTEITETSYISIKATNPSTSTK